MTNLMIEDFQIRLNNAHPKEKLKALSYISRSKEGRVKCLTCGEEYVKIASYFLDKRKKSICKKCFPTRPNILKETYELPEDYSYIESYKGMHAKVLVKHEKCGFIWGITPANIKLGKGCPKCNKKVSKGEQKITKWLNENKISYVTQYKIIIEGHNLFIDFYLPEYDLYIEYNGDQHYMSIPHFGGEEKFKIQKELDKLKKDYLKDKLLVIPYTQFENIEQILESSTTISKESTLQAMAMEAENLLNKGE